MNHYNKNAVCVMIHTMLEADRIEDKCNILLKILLLCILLV